MKGGKKNGRESSGMEGREAEWKRMKWTGREGSGMEGRAVVWKVVK